MELKYTTFVWQETSKRKRSCGAVPAMTSGHIPGMCVLRLCVGVFIINLQILFVVNIYIGKYHVRVTNRQATLLIPLGGSARDATTELDPS